MPKLVMLILFGELKNQVDEPNHIETGPTWIIRWPSLRKWIVGLGLPPASQSNTKGSPALTRNTPAGVCSWKKSLPPPSPVSGSENGRQVVVKSCPQIKSKRT